MPSGMLFTTRSPSNNCFQGRFLDFLPTCNTRCHELIRAGMAFRAIRVGSFPRIMGAAPILRGGLKGNDAGVKMPVCSTDATTDRRIRGLASNAAPRESVTRSPFLRALPHVRFSWHRHRHQRHEDAGDLRDRCDPRRRHGHLSAQQSKPGWSEQNPDDWWLASVKTVREVLKKGKIKPTDVKGIGLSGQMHGSVFLDKSHEVIRPALLWNDQRTAAECAEIEKRAGGRAALIGMVANPALTGFTAPKILWLRNHEPKNFAKTRRVLLPKDYVRLRMTGEFATEVSDASGTLLLDVKARNWSHELLGKLDLAKELLPSVHESETCPGD